MLIQNFQAYFYFKNNSKDDELIVMHRADFSADVKLRQLGLKSLIDRQPRMRTSLATSCYL